MLEMARAMGHLLRKAADKEWNHREMGEGIVVGSKTGGMELNSDIRHKATEF